MLLDLFEGPSDFLLHELTLLKLVSLLCLSQCHSGVFILYIGWSPLLLKLLLRSSLIVFLHIFKEVKDRDVELISLIRGLIRLLRDELNQVLLPLHHLEVL